MLLTLITVGKNDNYAGNFVQRLEHNINKLISNIDSLEIDDVEIIVTDWGSDSDAKLSDVMNVDAKPYLKFLHVSEELCQKYSPDSKFSCPHAANAAIRRSTGRYIMYLDGDSFIPKSTFSKLYNLLKEHNSNYAFYWCTRIIIPYQEQIQKSNIQELDELVEEWNNSGRKLVTGQEYFQGKGWCKSNVDLNSFGGGAMAILLSRNICEESSFWWEKLTKWGWMDVEYHHRLSSKYPCQGELSVILNDDFYHIGHHEVQNGHDLHGFNESVYPSSFHANDSSWGLIQENLELVTKK